MQGQIDLEFLQELQDAVRAERQDPPRSFPSIPVSDVAFHHWVDSTVCSRDMFYKSQLFLARMNQRFLPFRDVTALVVGLYKASFFLYWSSNELCCRYWFGFVCLQITSIRLKQTLQLWILSDLTFTRVDKPAPNVRRGSLQLWSLMMKSVPKSFPRPAARHTLASRLFLL